MLRMTTKEIAEVVGGKVKGATDLMIQGLHSLEAAGPSDLSFVGRKDMCKRAAQSKAGAILSAWDVPGFKGVVIECPDPERAMVKLLTMIHEKLFPRPTGIARTAVISPTAKLGKRVSVGHYAVIEDNAEIGDDVVIYPLVYIGPNVRIGERTVIQPHVSIFAYTQIGHDCEIHACAVLGDDGFGYIQRDGRNIKLPHVAPLHIGNETEVRSLVTIDRGMIDEAVIGSDVKIDDQCLIAHNCRVGDHCLIAGDSHLAGSVTLGKGVVMGGGSGVADHVTIGDGVRMGGHTGIMGNVKAGETYWGLPGRPLKRQMRIEALHDKLPEMHQKILTLEREIEDLKRRLAESK
jgi:UDP-3-O-[3-hydroxymyristoyl] glucosamine N-acyltransferase